MFSKQDGGGDYEELSGRPPIEDDSADTVECEPDYHAAGPCEGARPLQAALPSASEEHAVSQEVIRPIAADDRDLIIVEDDDAAVGQTARKNERAHRQEYRQLFATLRRR